MDILKSPKYHELQNLNFFYFETTEDLIRTSESMAAANALRQQEQAARLNRLSAPAGSGHQFGGAAGLLGMPTRKHKTIMLSKNLGTMRKAKEEKRKEAQADPNDDMILRILRMRPEAERYLRDRSRQKVSSNILGWNQCLLLTNIPGETGGCAGRRNDRQAEPERWWWTHDRNPTSKVDPICTTGYCDSYSPSRFLQFLLKDTSALSLMAFFGVIALPL